MRRSFCLLLCVLLPALTLCACGRPAAPEISQPAIPAQPAPETTEAPALPAESAAPAPSLSPGAAEESRICVSFAEEDGRLLTGAAVGGDIAYLNDRLPEGTGYISGFLTADGGMYAAVKDFYFSLEPSSLVFFPADGGPGEVLTDDLSADGRFCLAGGTLFYQSYADGGLWAYDTAAKTTSCVQAEPSALAAAADGFLYYVRSGGVYRNDSTMAAEALLFTANAVRLFAADGALCALVHREDGTASVEWRDTSGALTASFALPETADNLLYADGLAYVPQTGAGVILVLENGAVRGELPLAPDGSYCVLWTADARALYYETFRQDDGSFALIRQPLDGGEATVAGEMIVG